MDATDMPSLAVSDLNLSTPKRPGKYFMLERSYQHHSFIPFYPETFSHPIKPMFRVIPLTTHAVSAMLHMSAVLSKSSVLPTLPTPPHTIYPSSQMAELCFGVPGLSHVYGPIIYNTLREPFQFLYANKRKAFQQVSIPAFVPVGDEKDNIFHAEPHENAKVVASVMLHSLGSMFLDIPHGKTIVTQIKGMDYVPHAFYVVKSTVNSDVVAVNSDDGNVDDEFVHDTDDECGGD